MFVCITIWWNSRLLSWSCFTQFSKVARLKLKPRFSEFIERCGGYKIEKNWETILYQIYFSHIWRLPHWSMILSKICFLSGLQWISPHQDFEDSSKIYFFVPMDITPRQDLSHIRQKRHSIPGITFQISLLHISNIIAAIRLYLLTTFWLFTQFDAKFICWFSWSWKVHNTQ